MEALIEVINEFITEFQFVFFEGNRYKLILRGLGMTLKISVFAVIIGSILGFIVAFMKMLGERRGELKQKGLLYHIYTILSNIANLYIDIIRGTPSVVQLLIMYFIVFQSKYGEIAAITTFGINSSAYVAEIVRAGIQAVDKGQIEGGRSLGLSYFKTMRFIVIPQAIKNILPALGNEFIVLVKETAIVGYVAIQDLTKAGDFIISRTFRPFMPLIAIAVIYFIVIKIITKVLNTFEARLRKSDLR